MTSLKRPDERHGREEMYPSLCATVELGDKKIRESRPTGSYLWGNSNSPMQVPFGVD
jgi:hypothetical protein